MLNLIKYRTQTGKPNDGGYVLLFILGVLTVISVLIFSIILPLRMDAQLIGRQKTRLHDEYLLLGAINFVAAKLNIFSVTDGPSEPKTDRQTNSLDTGMPGGGPYTMTIDQRTVTIEITDAGTLPDANLLSEQEWIRLIDEISEDEPSLSAARVKDILNAKNSIETRFGTKGFLSLTEIASISSLPLNITNGDASKGILGIKDLLTVGTEKKQLDINNSPLVLFKILGGFNQSQVEELKKARAKGPITIAESQKMMANSVAKLMFEKTNSLRINAYILNVNGIDSGQYMLATLKQTADGYKIESLMSGDRF